ncbi:fimbria/pilus outer membrane usher protein [Salmonella enterica]|nr:fimbria/pilus outer membrane usher protein [Salmonella enterica]
MAIKSADNSFKINVIAFFICISCLSGTALAVEFNMDMVDANDKSNIDFSSFSRTGYIMPGKYPLRVLLNGEEIVNEMDIDFLKRADTEDDLPEACLLPSVTEMLGLTEATLKKLGTWNNGQCTDFRRVPATSLTPDLSAGVLNIVIPQAWLEYSDASWLPPSRWDNGIPGLLLDYNANGMVSKSNRTASQQYLSMNGTTGLNMGAWRLRADYQGSYTDSGQNSQSVRRDFDITRLYLFRPLPSIQSRLTIGQNYINSNLFESWRYAGVLLESDESMLPPNLRGYAPEIIGIARTNARVTVTQLGQVIYDSTVPAGPFRIQSLNTSTRGQLDVKVTEQDGKIETFTVSTASVPYLTRPGQLRYKLVAGKPVTWERDSEGPQFLSNDLSWGISNAWSLYGGSILSETYQSLAIGIGRDLFSLGTISLDVTGSRSDLSGAALPDNRVRKGKSWRVSYSKRFDDLNADVTFAGYRFSEKNFMTMQQFLDARYRAMDMDRQKERYQINATKRFDDIGVPLSLGLNYEHQTYWERGDTESVGVTAGTWFDLPSVGLRNVSLSLTGTRSQFYGRTNDSLSLMLSLPVGNGYGNASSNYSGKRYSHRVGYTGRVGELDSYNLSTGLNHGGNQEDSSSFSGMYSHTGSLANVSGNISLNSDDYQSAGLNISGGLTVTPEGAALHSGGYNGGTRMMISTGDVGGVPVDRGRAVTNRWGVAVLADVGSYYRATASVDANNLPEDVEISKGVVEAVLTEGAIGYREMTMLRGNRLFAIFRLKDGSFPPFGASVRNEKGRELGIIAENGLAWLGGVESGKTLSVVWGGKEQCRSDIPKKTEEGQQLLLPCEISLGRQ